jgi:hypothetical protein
MEVEAQAGAPPAPETQEAFIARRDSEIKTWLDRRAMLESVKPQEMEARNKVSATLFPNPRKGTQRYQLNGGYAIKLVWGTTYTLGDKTKHIDTPDGQVPIPINQQVNEALTKMRALGEEGVRLANELVKWKPELSETAYAALTPKDGPPSNIQAQAKTIIDEILTTKPKSPTLEFEMPKTDG